jgi:hypothetical protein
MNALSQTRQVSFYLTSTLLLIAFFSSSCSWDPFARTYSGPDRIKLSSAKSPLPDNSFSAQIEPAYSLPLSLKPGETANVNLVVTNTSQSSWPTSGASDGKYRVAVGNHWLDPGLNLVILDDGRAGLPYDIEPGGTAEVQLRVKAPTKPGRYVLEFDMVQEQVSWFAQRGSKTLRANIMIE